ncbi:MAG: hypothetical protein AAGK78_06960, partial [Planctomycetota bacterium]
MFLAAISLSLSLLAAQSAPTTAPAAPAAEADEAITAEQVIARFIEASGGKENQAQVRHRVHTGTMSVEGAPVAITGDVVLVMDFSQRFKLTTDLGNLGQIERVATPEVGWTRDPFSGVQI